MKALLIFLLGLLTFVCQGQNTSPGFVQPLGTTFGNQTVIRMLYAPSPAYGYGQALVYLPDGYNLPQNSNKYYPTYFFCPGSGETDDANIYEVTLASLPKLIAAGFKPYSIDTLTGDTVRWIVISQHATGGAAFAYPQLQYTIPYLLADTIFRIDTTCFWVGGLSNGCRATVSLYIGNNAGDSLIGKRITGINPISGAGYDNFQTSTNWVNFRTIMQAGGKVLYTIGSQDQNYNQVGYFLFDSAYAHWAVPPGFRGSYRHYVFNNVGHTSGVWEPCFQLNFKNFDSTQFKWNAWDLMWAMRKGAPTVTQTTCYAGANQVITLPTSSTTLSGIGTPSSGNVINSYLWSRTSGPNFPAITNSSNPTTTVTGLIAGTYVFNLHVVASDASTADAQVTITVNPATNQPPVANAGNDKTVFTPATTTTLNGSGLDNDGTISTYAWTKISGPTGGSITSPGSATTGITALQLGTYVFRLTVTDNQGATSFDDVQVIVQNPPLQAVRIKKVGLTEYKVGYLMSDSSVRGPVFNVSSGKVQLMSFVINSRKAIDVTAGFNQLMILDDQGFTWTTNRAVAGQTANQCTRIDTDTSGTAANYIGKVYGYFYTWLAISKDSTKILELGGNSYEWHDKTVWNASPTGQMITKWYPIQMMAGNKKIVKLSLGQNVVALTLDGQVWELVKGDSTWRQKTLPGGSYAVDIATSHYPWSFAIVHDYAGGASNMGNPYVWGSQSDFWGNPTPVSYTQPTSVKTLWSLTSPIRVCNMNQNVFHFIDSMNRHYAVGDNPNGEMGTGEELVNQWFYPTRYAWSWVKSEFIKPITLINDGVDWSGNCEIFANNSYAFFLYFRDKNDSIYFVGRDKSFVGGAGKVNNNESQYPNALDVIRITMRTPLDSFKVQGTSFNFSQPTINLTPNQTITTTTIQLTANATAAQAGNIYWITGYKWSLQSGPAVTIDNINNQTINVSGLSGGNTYIFRCVATDNNTATVMGQDTIIVNNGATTPPTLTTNGNQVIILPINSVNLVGTATPHGGGVTITAQGWSKISGPTAGNVTSTTNPTTTATGLVAGNYTFRFSATDSNGQTVTSDVLIQVNTTINSCNCLIYQTPTKYN